MTEEVDETRRADEPLNDGRTPGPLDRRDLSPDIPVESAAQRRAKRIAPWIVSVVLHILVIALGFLVTWTVATLQDESGPEVIVADFDAPTFEPVAVVQSQEQKSDQPRVQDQVRPEDIADATDPSDVSSESTDWISDAALESPAAPFAPKRSEGDVRFMGVSATNARRIVYVIDASGSMITWMQTVIDGMIRSLDGLIAEQDFNIIFSKGEKVLIVPPPNRLHVATEEEKLRAIQWVEDNVIPGGSSNPIMAIEKALRLKPDVVFLLSTNITGRGIYEIDQDELLAELDRLNPVDPDTGRRPTRINCIQFLDPDPLDTLKKIANRHGGPNGYKFVDREELGIASP